MEETVLELIGARIKCIREVSNITRAELSEAANISDKFLYEIEKGKRAFSIIVLMDLCSALDISYKFILSGDKEFNIDEEICNAIDMFDETQINLVKNIINKILELSRF